MGIEEVLTFLLRSENRNNIIIKRTIPIHTTLIFKEKSKFTGLREKGLTNTHYSIHHIEGYDIICFNDIKQDLHASCNKK
jgi:hypothetical protein